MYVRYSLARWRALAAAIRDCADELWETSMWVVPTRDADAELTGQSQSRHGQEITAKKIFFWPKPAVRRSGASTTV
jgi:hypothetical protein